MSKFNNILLKYGIIVEQPQEQPIGTPNPTEIEGAEQSALSQPSSAEGSVEPTIDNQQIPQSEVKKLSPASFVWLVTVLKNAFLAHPELEDQKNVAELKDDSGDLVEEINPENAQRILDKMWPIISKYMPSEIKTYRQTDQAVAKLLQKAE